MLVASILLTVALCMCKSDVFALHKHPDAQKQGGVQECIFKKH